jgi:Sigma-70, region 4
MLSPRERQALWHSAVEHRGIGDIAERLQLSYMAAAQVIHRARKHALQLAARVAIVFGAIRLGRSASRMSLTAVRLVAVPVIAISAISMQSAGTPSGSAAAQAKRDAVAGLIRHPQAASAAGGAAARSRASSDLAQVPGSATATLQSAAAGLQHSLNALPGNVAPSLPGLPVTVPTPALPVVSPLPTALP